MPINVEFNLSKPRVKVFFWRKISCSKWSEQFQWFEVKEAIAKDKNKNDISENSISGMPILLKDNINTKEMPTTAGAIALARNHTKNDAFIVEKLKENGA